MSPRAYRLSKAMRMLAEARIGRIISVDSAQEIHDSLIWERRLLARSLGCDLDPHSEQCLSYGWIRDEMGPHSNGEPCLNAAAVPGESFRDADGREDIESDEKGVIPIRISIRAARLLAMGERPPVLLLVAAVRELQSHFSDDRELSDEFKRLHMDIMCNRRQDQWRDAV